MKPKVSVVLSFFNAEKTLEVAVECILQQTFPGFELLLINNCSTVKTFSIVQKLAKKDRWICLLPEEKPGVVHAMNC